MTAVTTATSELDIGRVARRTFDVLKDHGLTVVVLSAAICLAPSAAFAWAEIHFGWTATPMAMAWSTGASMLVNYASLALLRGALVHLAVGDLSDRPVSLADSVLASAKCWLPLVGIAVLSSILTLVGYALLIVPGVILSLALAVQIPVEVVERQGVIASMRRSIDLTRGRRGAIFGLAIAFAVLSLILSLAVKSAFGLPFSQPAHGRSVIEAFENALSSSTWISILAQTLILAIREPISTIGGAALYYELRSIKEGIGPEGLAATFD